MMPTLLEHAANSVAAEIAAHFLILGATAVLGKVALFAGRWPLRRRLGVGLAALATIAIIVLWLGLIPPTAILIGLGTASVGFALYVLKDISRVGIVNSFGSTETGITPVKSLSLAKRKFDFLGIGANKLTENTSEFAETVRRCRAAGGHIRLLLSNPQNPALTTLAHRLGRDSQSYAGRVRESIRQILHVNQENGGNVITVKLYELTSDFSFPHFRLMFTDDRICILSHVVWNASEGMDNPQLVIRSKDQNPDESLYTAYMRYFDDLWNAVESQEVTSSGDPRLDL
jgi:hypothetical protein